MVTKGMELYETCLTNVAIEPMYIQSLSAGKLARLMRQPSLESLPRVPEAITALAQLSVSRTR